MSILTDKLPSTVEVGGSFYEIDTAFTTSIRFESLILDDTLSQETKQALALNLYFPVIPADTREALRAISLFYECGRQKERGKAEQTGAQANDAVYSLEHDAPYIYAAFWECYHIDLQRRQTMHWWAFRTLFDALSKKTLFMQILGWRAADLRKLKGEEKQYYTKMKRLYALPKPRGQTEKEDAIANALLSGGDVSKILENLQEI